MRALIVYLRNAFALLRTPAKPGFAVYLRNAFALLRTPAKPGFAVYLRNAFALLRTPAKPGFAVYLRNAFALLRTPAKPGFAVYLRNAFALLRTPVKPGFAVYLRNAFALLRTPVKPGFAIVSTIFLVSCSETIPRVALTDNWPARVDRSYDDITAKWTRTTHLRGLDQEALELSATFKSPEWRFAHAERLANHRGLAGAARDQHMAQAQAESTGPYEIEMMVTTWDRRENDLDRGKRSVWRVVMLDEAGNEVEPLEITKDKRPAVVVRAEFPALGEFATPYIVKFARTTPLLGPAVKQLRLRMSNERAGVEVRWEAR